MILPRGFRGGACRAGIKESGRPDLALVFTERPVPAAAAFTRNRFAAAPVVLSRARLAGRDTFRAVLANAGCANAATGAAGLEVARRTTAYLAERIGALPEEVLAASTGVIGPPLDAEKVNRGVERILAEVEGRAEDELEPLAEAILTTDTRPKLAVRRVGEAAVVGFAKGAGMIHPELEVARPPHATMLAFLFTDAAASAGELRAALTRFLPDTLNAVTVDGDTSTNDSVFLFASGEGGEASGWEEALGEVLDELAEGIVADGEGATRVAEVVVADAASAEDARRAASTIATSPLVKTALAGGDANWGRILAALGRSGAAFDPDRVSLSIGGVVLFQGGVPAGGDLARAEAAMKKPRVAIEVRLGAGEASARYRTTDLTAEYVRINADYTT